MTSSKSGILRHQLLVAAAAWLTLLTPAARAGTFAEFLTDAGVEPAQLAELADAIDAGRVLTDQEVNTAREVLTRLRQLSASATNEKLAAQQAAQADAPGALVQIRGDVAAIQALATPEDAEAAIAQSAARPTHILTVTSPEGPWKVLMGEIPRAWRGESISADAPAPIVTTAVVLRPRSTEGQEGVALAARTAWYPREGVPPGWQWLAAHGFDVGLLDEVRHNAPFVKPSVSREGEAFHECLRAVAAGTPVELEQMARAEVLRIRDDPKFAASLVQESTDEPAAELAKTEQLVHAMQEAAAGGTTSVAPMFLRPQETAGRFVLVEGVVRRAVQVLEANGAEGEAAARADAKAEPRVSHYELELFTNDSQDLPIVCCVARLPDGFPLGDSIRESARVGGVFFKLWSYGGRPDEDGVSHRTRGPVVMAAAPT
ncbi:MAG: hypothetical protein KDA44_13215, partial [Planctomycetales bacterium]|nr:hypothetical protein [Planctomycetales bacterium]